MRIALVCKRYWPTQLAPFLDLSLSQFRFPLYSSSCTSLIGSTNSYSCKVMGEIILKQADFPGRFFFAKILLFTVALSRMPIFDWSLRLKFHGRKRRIYSFDVKVFYCITLSLLFSCSKGSPLLFSRFLVISHFFHEFFAFF